MIRLSTTVDGHAITLASPSWCYFVDAPLLSVLIQFRIEPFSRAWDRASALRLTTRKCSSFRGATARLPGLRVVQRTSRKGLMKRDQDQIVLFRHMHWLLRGLTIVLRRFLALSTSNTLIDFKILKDALPMGPNWSKCPLCCRMTVTSSRKSIRISTCSWFPLAKVCDPVSVPGSFLILLGLPRKSPHRIAPPLIRDPPLIPLLLLVRTLPLYPRTLDSQFLRRHMIGPQPMRNH